MKTIGEALSYAQRKIKAPKNQRNNFGKYNYRSCEDILTGLKEVMPEGATTTLSDEVTMVGDRFYVVATATFKFGEDSVSVKGWARECLSKKGMDDSQLTGSCSSYARKYALNGLFAIDDSKDADTDEQHRQASNAPQEKETSDRMLNCLNVLVSSYEKDNWAKAKQVLDALRQEKKKEVWSKLSGPIRVWIQSNTQGEK